MLAVKVTVVVIAGLTTTPVLVTILGLLDDQATVVPFWPVVGRPRFCVTLDAESPLAYVIWRAALASATARTSEKTTVTVNVFVSIALPLTMVAVSVTFVVLAGLVTIPELLTTPELLETQAIVVPLGPVVARPMFCVTFDAESPLT
jgi:hypothetical protein